MRLDFYDIINKAKKLAAQPYQEPISNIPEFLKKIGYDEWRGIRFKPANSLWAEGPFSIQFFHPGFIYQQPVFIHTIDKEGTHGIPFSSNLFNYSQYNKIPPLTTDIGFAGFRIHYPLNTPTYADELISFLGASYFRALGKNLSYGISARGLAIDTAEDTGEEFPCFKEFWIVRPSSKSREITLFALLDSPSVTGAYEFLIRPGEETLVDVKSTLFMRKKVRKLGIAPLSSMFFFGENSRLKGSTDFRPEVHDSDGLLIHDKSGEWTWHPLINPPKLLINGFGGGQPLGFGLLQRDINFDHYQDLEARYDRRPSVWVTPHNNWGAGHIELLQLPTENEYNDNIGAYWVPEQSWEPGQMVEYSYSLSWYSSKHKLSPLGSVEATRIIPTQDSVTFLIDFLADKTQASLLKKTLTADIQAFNGYKITNSQIINNPVTGGWRLIIKVLLDKTGFLKDLLPNQIPAMELRAFLKDGGSSVTETWSYTYLP